MVFAEIVTLANQLKWDRKAPSGGGKSASLWRPTELGLPEWRFQVKKAVPVRMPDWPEEEFPTTQEVGVYLLFWEHQRKQLAPGAGFLQKSYWLDSEDLEISAYQAECLRAGRPDRALFIRRLIATYHKPRMSRPMPMRTPAMRQPANTSFPTGLLATTDQVLQRVPAETAVQEKDLTPAEVTEISRIRGLGMSWQPGNVYRVGKTANGRSCLVQFDSQGRELTRYGLW